MRVGSFNFLDSKPRLSSQECARETDDRSGSRERLLETAALRVLNHGRKPRLVSSAKRSIDGSGTLTPAGPGQHGVCPSVCAGCSFPAPGWQHPGRRGHRRGLEFLHPAAAAAHPARQWPRTSSPCPAPPELRRDPLESPHPRTALLSSIASPPLGGSSSSVPPPITEKGPILKGAFLLLWKDAALPADNSPGHLLQRTLPGSRPKAQALRKPDRATKHRRARHRPLQDRYFVRRPRSHSNRPNMAPARRAHA